jgi:hypothetical protein
MHNALVAALPRTFTPKTARRVIQIQALTLVWMSVEAVVSLGAAWAASSPALLGFGGDSAVELLSAAVVLRVSRFATACSLTASGRGHRFRRTTSADGTRFLVAKRKVGFRVSDEITDFDFAAIPETFGRQAGVYPPSLARTDCLLGGDRREPVPAFFLRFSKKFRGWSEPLFKT